jgi:hypothetical protein
MNWKKLEGVPSLQLVAPRGLTFRDLPMRVGREVDREEAGMERYYLNEYITNRFYGGSEEGGWWLFNKEKVLEFEEFTERCGGSEM